MVLICGPTGSGKSTTLYATLRRLNALTDNILTIEDPIEYTLEGVNQVQAQGGDRPYVHRRTAYLPAAGPRHHHAR